MGDKEKMSAPQKNIEKWREDWSRVVQVKRTETKTRDRKTYDERTTELTTISIAKEYQNEAKDILKVVAEILRHERKERQY